MDSVKQQKEIEKFKSEEQCKLEHITCCNQLSVEQFKDLRSQISMVLKETRSLELYALGGVVAYYAWLFTHCIPSAPVFGSEIPSRLIPWLIPVILPVLGAWRVMANVWALLVCAEYIVRIEDECDKTPCHIGPDKGWENYVRGNRAKRKTCKSSVIMNEDKSREDEQKSWDEMPRWRKIWIVGNMSHYWPFWIFLTLLTLLMFVISFSISESLSQQTCSASPMPTTERSMDYQTQEYRL
jgi:hypothetical protein